MSTVKIVKSPDAKTAKDMQHMLPCVFLLGPCDERNLKRPNQDMPRISKPGSLSAAVAQPNFVDRPSSCRERCDTRNEDFRDANVVRTVSVRFLVSIG